jgi:hypothetical protein
LADENCFKIYVVYMLVHCGQISFLFVRLWNGS